MIDRIIKIGIGTNNQNHVAPAMVADVAVASSNTFPPPKCWFIQSYANRTDAWFLSRIDLKKPNTGTTISYNFCKNIAKIVLMGRNCIFIR